MAPVGPGFPRRQGPSLSGSMMIDTVRGQPRARAWPKPRGKAKSKEQKEAQDDFRRASEIIKRQPADIQRPLIAATEGTPFYPRDLAMMALFGRLYLTSDEHGRQIRALAVSLDVSKSLDLIADQPGSILVRGPDRWQGSFQQSAFANWLFNYDSDSFTTTFSGSGFAFKGGVWDVLQSFTIYSSMFWARWEQAATYRAMLAIVDGSRKLTDVQLSIPWTAPVTGQYPIRFDVGRELFIGERYALAIGRVDGPATYAMPAVFNQVGAFKLPVFNRGSFRIATTTPTVGQTYDNAGGSAQTVACGVQAFV